MGQFALSKNMSIFAILLASFLISLNIVNMVPESDNMLYYIFMVAIISAYVLVCYYVIVQPLTEISAEDAPKMEEREDELRIDVNSSDSLTSRGPEDEEERERLTK